MTPGINILGYCPCKGQGDHAQTAGAKGVVDTTRLSGDDQVRTYLPATAPQQPGFACADASAVG
jgi:hypothetical protein